MDLGLCGKVVVITGGTAGIGLATANAFLQEGASVAVCGRRRELLDDAVKTLGEAVFACQADMTDEADVSSFAHQVYAHLAGSTYGSIMSGPPLPVRATGIRRLK